MPTCAPLPGNQAPTATASRPSSASRSAPQRTAAGSVLQRKPDRGAVLLAQARREGSTLFETAQGATTAAFSAVQNIWDSRENLDLPPLPDAQALVSLVASRLPQTKGASKQRAHQQEVASLEAREAAALKLLQGQADSNEAVQLLRKRAAEGSTPGQRRDGAKLGLVVEGGGMRGAVSGGALQALHDLGLRDCFDVIYGSSAGAINATYFLSGQRQGVDIYSQDITNSDFIDLRRLLKPKDPSTARPALDLGYLLDHVMEKIKPLNWQAVVDSPIPLKIVASCLDTLQPILLGDFIDKEDLRECLRASAAVPEVAGPPIQHRGRRLVDAAVFEAIPFRAAIADGCTHIIALPTRPPYKRSDLVGKLIDDTVATVVKKAVLSPTYMRQAWIRETQYQRAFGCTPEDLLVKSLQPEAHKLPGMAGCHVFPFFPGAAASYSPLCIDAATIMLGIAEGRAAIQRILGHPAPRPAPAVAPRELLAKPAVAATSSMRGH